MKFNLLPFSAMREVWDSREEPENLHLLGIYVWRMLIVFAIIALVCAAYFGIQELNAVTQAENIPQASKAPPAPLDPNKLQTQLDAFSARQQTYQSLSSSPLPQVSDPSK